MPESSSFDVRFLDNLELPYDVSTKELSDTPRLVAGNNMWITPGGKLSLRPGIGNTGAGSVTSSLFIGRVFTYETIEDTPKIYIFVSVFDNADGFWKVYYTRHATNLPSLTPLSNVNDINESVYMHEFIAARGLLFIRGYGIDLERETVIFDGVNNVARPWGMLPLRGVQVLYQALSGTPTAAVTVRAGWKYAYCYKDQFGHLSGRTGESTAPGFPNSTGAFTNQFPNIGIFGNADTTNIPTISIFRTTDGGGTYYHLDDIPNPGAEFISYQDNKREAANTNNPKTDFQLDVFNIAPSLTSNDPPPAAGPKLGSPMAYFARRIWFFYDEILFFSGNEEISNGMPESSFVAPGGIRGNFMNFQYGGRYIQETNDGLYVITSHDMHLIRGDDRTNLRPIRVAKVGGATGHPRASCVYKNVVFFLTNDLQIAAVKGLSEPVVISQPLGEQLKTSIDAENKYVQMEVWEQDNSALLMVLVGDLATANNTIYVFDLNREIWFTPWNVGITALGETSRMLEGSYARKFLVTWYNSNTNTFFLGYLDKNKSSDLADTVISASATINLVSLPPGNHINALRAPGHHPMLSYLITDRTSGGTELTVEYRLDEFSGTYTPVTPVDPPFTAQHTSYKTLWYPIQKVCQKVQMKISKTPATPEALEIQNIGFVFQSEAGA